MSELQKLKPVQDALHSPGSLRESSKKRSKIALNLIAISLGMLGFGYGMVPLYKVFCKKTGYLGTVKDVAHVNQNKIIIDKPLKILFNSDVAKGLPLKFRPEQGSINTKPGQNSLAFYTVENLSDKEITGIAVYNVTPHKAAQYFNKVYCFCFEKQIFAPRSSVTMPVSFFIDTEIAKDKSLQDLDTLTLSYTFYQYPE